MHSPSLPSLLQLLVAGPIGLGAAVGHSPNGAPQEHELLQRSLEAGTWAGETRSALGDLSTCKGCESVLNVLKGIASEGNDEIISLGKQLCLAGTSYDETFCDGILTREVPVIAGILKDMEVGSKTSKLFCNAFLGVCEPGDIDEWNVEFPSHKPCNEVKSTSGHDPIKIVQISDIHIDPLYVAGSSTQCKKATCCRLFSKEDTLGNTTSPAGPNGDHNCDVPVTLEKSMYKAIKDMFPDAAFTMFTGDIVDHSLFNTSKPYNEAEIRNAYENMNDYLKLVYGTAGNHESHPANIFQPNSLGNDTMWVYESLADQWSRWISSEAEDEVKKIGAYSTKVPDMNLRIISLNTNLYYKFNFILYQKEMEKDPNGQIAWLVKELDAAEKAGENVYIIGHMPFGEKDAIPDASNYLDQVVNRYSATIKAMFFGHTHVDHFEVSYSDYSQRAFSKATAMSYICPSLTPTSGMPSFRVYEIDPVTFSVLDATTYMADMDDKAFQTTGPVWKKYYSAKDVYGSIVTPPLDSKAALTPAFWHNVTEAFESKQDLFDAYMARKSRGWNASNKCRDECQKEEICQLRAGRAQDNCDVPKPGVHFSKRGESRGEHDDCGMTVSREILSALAARQDLLDLVQKRFMDSKATVQPVKRAEIVKRSASAGPTGRTDLECPATTTSGTATGSGSAATPSKTGGAAGVGSMGAMAMLALGALAV